MAYGYIFVCDGCGAKRESMQHVFLTPGPPKGWVEGVCIRTKNEVKTDVLACCAECLRQALHKAIDSLTDSDLTNG